MEHWKTIKDFPAYEVSNLGNVRHKKHKVIRKAGKSGKYLNMKLVKDSVKYSVYVHHLVLEAFIGPKPPGTECCHNNGNSLDNRSKNLRWDTHVNNLKDREKHGTICKGSKHYKTDLTEQDIINIRQKFSKGVKQCELAKLYNMRWSCIHSIVIRRSWKHI